MGDNTIKRIAAKELVPVDRVAARVIGRGVHYTPNKVVLTADSDLPIQTGPSPGTVADLVGCRFGHFTVLGWYAEGNGWVVKCSCGIYTVRKTRAVLNPQNSWDRCERCRHLMYLKRDEHWRVHGKSIPLESL